MLQLDARRTFDRRSVPRSPRSKRRCVANVRVAAHRQHPHFDVALNDVAALRETARTLLLSRDAAVTSEADCPGRRAACPGRLYTSSGMSSLNPARSRGRGGRGTPAGRPRRDPAPSGAREAAPAARRGRQRSARAVGTALPGLRDDTGPREVTRESVVEEKKEVRKNRSRHRARCRGQRICEPDSHGAHFCAAGGAVVAVEMKRFGLGRSGMSGL